MRHLRTTECRIIVEEALIKEGGEKANIVNEGRERHNPMAKRKGQAKEGQQEGEGQEKGKEENIQE